MSGMCLCGRGEACAVCCAAVASMLAPDPHVAALERLASPTWNRDSRIFNCAWCGVRRAAVEQGRATHEDWCPTYIASKALK